MGVLAVQIIERIRRQVLCLLEAASDHKHVDLKPDDVLCVVHSNGTLEIELEDLGAVRAASSGAHYMTSPCYVDHGLQVRTDSEADLGRASNDHVLQCVAFSLGLILLTLLGDAVSRTEDNLFFRQAETFLRLPVGRDAGHPNSREKVQQVLKRARELIRGDLTPELGAKKANRIATLLALDPAKRPDLRKALVCTSSTDDRRITAADKPEHVKVCRLGAAYGSQLQAAATAMWHRRQYAAGLPQGALPCGTCDAEHEQEAEEEPRNTEAQEEEEEWWAFADENAADCACSGRFHEPPPARVCEALASGKGYTSKYKRAFNRVIRDMLTRGLREGTIRTGRLLMMHMIELYDLYFYRGILRACFGNLRDKSRHWAERSNLRLLWHDDTCDEGEQGVFGRAEGFDIIHIYRGAFDQHCRPDDHGRFRMEGMLCNSILEGVQRVFEHETLHSVMMRCCRDANAYSDYRLLSSGEAGPEHAAVAKPAHCYKRGDAVKYMGNFGTVVARGKKSRRLRLLMDSPTVSATTPAPTWSSTQRHQMMADQRDVKPAYFFGMPDDSGGHTRWFMQIAHNLFGHTRFDCGGLAASFGHKHC